MRQTRMNPTTLAAGRVPEKIVCVVAAINPDNTRPLLETQRLRAVFRRVALSPAVAAIVAELAYGEAHAS